MIKKYPVFVLSLSLLALSQQGWANDKLATSIDDTFADLNPVTPGCAAGIVKDGVLLDESYAGQANLRYQIPVDKKTRFNIGSISKHMTAALIFQLESEGKLARTDTLKKYYPTGPNWFEQITLYHLIHHQSGLPDYLQDKPTGMALVALLSEHPKEVSELLIGQSLPRKLVFDLILDYMAQLPAPIFTPGESASYSNTGYMLLADIAEQASGVGFAQLAEEKLFSPLGMTSTQVTHSTDSNIPWSATGYSIDDANKYQVAKSLVSSHGDGGVVTTLEDFSKWVTHLMAPQRQQTLWAEFLNPQDPVFGPAPKFGSAQYINGLSYVHGPEGEFYSHNGLSLDNMQSVFWLEPKLKLSYIQLCNFSFKSQPQLVDLIATYGKSGASQPWVVNMDSLY